ncbi:hypothetical protein EDB86DRAFT_2832065 [Lactarius hatsudake]|nr:hypothetical protein EDB86DRAFT_2832065 [Lactarius hatsudake]
MATQLRAHGNVVVRLSKLESSGGIWRRRLAWLDKITEQEQSLTKMACLGLLEGQRSLTRPWTARPSVTDVSSRYTPQLWSDCVGPPTPTSFFHQSLGGGGYNLWFALRVQGGNIVYGSGQLELRLGATITKFSQVTDTNATPVSAFLFTSGECLLLAYLPQCDNRSGLGANILNSVHRAGLQVFSTGPHLGLAARTPGSGRGRRG